MAVLNNVNYIAAKTYSGIGWKLNRPACIFWLCLIGILFLPPLLKQAILGGNGSFFNPFFVAAFILCLAPRKLRGVTIAELVMLFCVVFLCVVAVYSNLSAGYSVYSCFKAFLTLNFPLVLLIVWRSLIFKESWMLQALKIFNWVVLFLFVWAIVNAMLSGALVDSLARFAQGLVDIKNLDRLWSPYGHPLYNAALFLAFFCLNTVAAKRGHRLMPVWVVLLVPALGLLLCASKSAFLIFLVLILLWYATDVRWALLVISFGVILFAFGGFDLIASRFSQGISSGRFETWDLLGRMDILRPFGFMSGYGISSTFNLYDEQLAWASSAFEFPVLGYSLSYGIAYTIVLYAIMFLYPIVIMVKSKEWIILATFIAVGLHMNSYNGLFLVSDYFAIFVFFTVVLMQLTKTKQSARNRETANGGANK